MKTKIVSLLAAVALIAIGFTAVHAAEVQQTPTPPPPPAAAPVYYNAAPPAQLVCGHCGEFLQQPQIVHVAQPLRPPVEPRGAYADPRYATDPRLGIGGGSFYGIPAVGYLPPPPMYPPEYYGYRVPVAPRSIWLSHGVPARAAYYYPAPGCR